MTSSLASLPFRRPAVDVAAPQCASDVPFPSVLIASLAAEPLGPGFHSPRRICLERRKPSKSSTRNPPPGALYGRGKGLSIAAPPKKKADHRLFVVMSFSVSSGHHFGDQLGIIWLLVDANSVGPYRGGDRRG